MKKILFTSSITASAGLNLRLGVLDYINNGHDCDLRMMNNIGELTSEAISHVIRDGIDGILAGIMYRNAAWDHLLSFGIPTVLMLVDSFPPKKTTGFSALVRNDDREIGARAARHFLSRGNFRSYAYVPTDEPDKWSDDRGNGFARELALRNLPVSVMDRAAPNLREFVRGLMRPAAIFCATDQLAINVITTCCRLRLRVPSQVAVIGVDDDEDLCESTRPSLTSIRTSDREVGRLAAELLFREIDGQHPRDRHVLIPPVGVTERDSTRIVSPSAHIISEGLAYIRKNFRHDISADDVIRHLGVSGTLARKRFREIHGAGIKDEIIKARLDAAAQMLGNTTAPLSRIARECGFSSACRMSHAFAERLQRSPASFRQIPPDVRIR